MTQKNLKKSKIFTPSGEIRMKSGKCGREIPRLKMHALKIAQCLEPQGFEGCERVIFCKLSSYYIHHFNKYKSEKKAGIIYPHNEKKSGYNIPTGRTPAGILYPPRQQKSGYNIPTKKAFYEYDQEPSKVARIELASMLAPSGLVPIMVWSSSTRKL